MFCTAPAVREVYCNEITREWTIDGPATITRVNFAQLVIVNGDLFTDEIVIGYISFELRCQFLPLPNKLKDELMLMVLSTNLKST
jgi:hypothetical protein